MNPGNHTHDFVNQYQGLVGFGLDRDTDEKSLMVYLQKFSDDTFLKTLLPRDPKEKIEEILVLISRLLKTHLKEEEYHELFLKRKRDNGGCQVPSMLNLDNPVGFVKKKQDNHRDGEKFFKNPLEII